MTLLCRLCEHPEKDHIGGDRCIAKDNVVSWTIRCICDKFDFDWSI